MNILPVYLYILGRPNQSLQPKMNKHPADPSTPPCSVRRVPICPGAPNWRLNGGLTPFLGEIASPVRAPAPAPAPTTPPPHSRRSVPGAPKRPRRQGVGVDGLPLVNPILLRQYAQDGLGRHRG